MLEIEHLRSQIEEIHVQLFKLLRSRADLVHRIWDHKKKSQMGLDDPAREDDLIHQFDAEIAALGDPHFAEFYHNVVRAILSENKKYLVRED